jgi:phosphohistidine phosphatase
MKHLTLVLVRHAEAATLAESDHARPLTPSGRSQATSIGPSLTKIIGSCDIAIVSSAIRAKETLEQISKTLPIHKTEIDPGLYTAHSDVEFSKVIQSHTSETTQKILVVGHNPVISVSANIYSGQSLHFATGEFLVLSQHADSWELALGLDGCWQALNSST